MPTVERPRLSLMEFHIQFDRISHSILKEFNKDPALHPPPPHCSCQEWRCTLICIQTWYWWFYSVNIETQSIYIRIIFSPINPRGTW